ncbi:hypothetical protein FNH22_13515 [Fulvivirga sp. M361]|uniref:hypothetical protein n=1 Tax=Fulvivirga sp. M361 TaxID=2594266 RepID=UPI00117BB81A|nr:hypothetical protein [Fulvivirga sp. M361]TRX58362.1 hypothetical protein FNH22_13515 [Fulvivirga sp. M361]
MANKFFFSLFFSLSIGLNAQNLQRYTFHSNFESEFFLTEHDGLAKQLMADPQVNREEHLSFDATIGDYISQLSAKRRKFRTQRDFVSAVFYKTHRKFLKRYRELTSFADMLRTGNYDCLSATTLYSHLFQKLSIRHEIVETNYHIYINVMLEEGNILIESTDPLYGFVSNTKEIEERLQGFEARNNSNTGKRSYTFKAKLNDPVTRDELVGLQYYNASIKAYNEHEFGKSAQLLQKALLFRHNARTYEFCLLLVQTIMNDTGMDDNLRSRYVHQLKSLMLSDNTLASR